MILRRPPSYSRPLTGGSVLGQMVKDRPVVLIIDNDLDAQAELCDLLNDLGFDIAASNSSHAIAYIWHQELAGCPIKGILLNIQEPVSGLGLLHELHQQYPRIPIILLSSWVEGDILDVGLHIGACDGLLKPLNFDLLREKCRLHFLAR